MFQYLEEKLKAKTREVVEQTKVTVIFIGLGWFLVLNKCIAFS